MTTTLAVQRGTVRPTAWSCRCRPSGGTCAAGRAAAATAAAAAMVFKLQDSCRAFVSCRVASREKSEWGLVRRLAALLAVLWVVCGREDYQKEQGM